MNNKITVFRKVIYIIVSLIIATFIFLFVRQSIDNNYTENNEKYIIPQSDLEEETIEETEEVIKDEIISTKLIKDDEQIDLKYISKTSIIEEKFELKKHINKCETTISNVAYEEKIDPVIEINIEPTIIEPVENRSFYLLGYFTDAEINEITNVVNGEVGGICGSVVLTYADGSQLYSDASLLRMIHTKVVENQVKSSLFPSSVDSCVKQCWSWSYAGTSWRESSQWQSCREAVVNALNGGVSVPSNVYAATCDAYFASYGAGWYLWARVDWNTGWFSGTFYYYQYIG